jgi:hypothetical protein
MPFAVCGMNGGRGGWMATIVSVSDFHIHGDSKLEMIRKFVQRMDVLKPDILVYLGDVGDPWEKTWEIGRASCRERVSNNV